MNKPFTYYIMAALLSGIIAGLCLKIGYKDASGILTSVTAVAIILGLSWGFFSDPHKVRKRNLMRLGLFVFAFHLIVFATVGANDKLVEALNENNLSISVKTAEQTKENLLQTKTMLISFLRFEPAGFEGIVWNYVIFSIGLGIATYKLLASFGWPCVLTIIPGIGMFLYLLRYWNPERGDMNYILIAIGLTLLVGSFFLGKKTWNNPATA